MKRIILHWTGGAGAVSDLDREHYHAIVDAAGRVTLGEHDIEDNLNCNDGDYAAHTRGCNTGSIGLAIAAMGGATERNPRASRHLPTRVQVDALCRLAAKLARAYCIPVQRETILNHGEVERVLGNKQAGKWDINWLPWDIAPHKSAGDWLRARIAAYAAEETSK